MASTPDLPRSLTAALGDRYRIERELGRGGMATVYSARDLKHDRAVALKVLHPELGAVLGAERFEREIKMAARLHHPHILQFHDSGEAAGHLYFVMPLVEGESLRERLRREGRLPLDEVVRVAREVGAALDYAHRHGVVHRDVKPENVLLTDGGALVADFGVARALGAAGGEHLTQTGLLVGTPAYMSPEQAAGSAELDGRSDQYALACVAFEVLAGEPLFAGPTPQAVIAQRFRDAAPRLDRLPPGFPGAVRGVLARALAPEPAERFPSAADFAEALGRAAAEPTSSRDTRSRGGTPARGGGPRRRWALAGVAALLAAVAAWAVVRHRPWAATPALDHDAVAVLPFRVADPALALWREGLVDLFATDLDGAGSWRTVHPRTALSRWRPRG